MNDQLRALADELAIRNVTAAYTDAINRLDAAEATVAYADDGALDMMDRPTVVGRTAITDVLRATVAKYQIVTQLMHSGVVRLDGDQARARWQVTEFQVSHEGIRRFVIGRYEDSLVRLPEGWRFSHRRFTARYLGAVDLSSDVLPDPPVGFPIWGS